MDKRELTERLSREAARLGFTLTGACPAVPATGWTRLLDWLALGYAGDMHYLQNRAAAYEDPQQILSGARSLLMLALPYRTSEPRTPGPLSGRISRYAWGPADYHDVVHERLHRLADYLRTSIPGATARGVVDTAPLLEREFAQLAGLGWIGKNTLLLNKHAGSWFFLAALLTDQELDYDAPHATDHCGTCRRCLDACPTQAFPAPYVLDATRCISYLTIELRSSIPRELRTGLGDWVFGCDICQEVCPWNRRSPEGDAGLFGPRADANPVPLPDLFRLDEQQFRDRFRGSPLWRPRRRGLLRNAAIVLGNRRDPAAVASLRLGLQDAEPLVREASAWALGQIGTADAREALAARLACEEDDDVRREIRIACGPSADRPAS
ncbi:MAG: tRNA epoxyqueuosine(34) reductase QueG [Pirellulaceae bacterium]